MLPRMRVRYMSSRCNTSLPDSIPVSRVARNPSGDDFQTMTFSTVRMDVATIDGAGPMRFFKDILLSTTSIAALFVIQFIYGWNQYLWPLLMTTDESMYPVVMGIKRLIGGEAYTEWNVVMATAVLAMLPPAVVVILMQKWFVKGLVDAEK